MNKHNIKRVLTILLSAVMIFSTPMSVSATNPEISAAEKRCIEEVLVDYHTQIQSVEMNANLGTVSVSENAVNSMKLQTITNLRSAGYEAYDVNKDTFAEIEHLLQTDLEAINLDPTCSYIVAVGGGETEARSVHPVPDDGSSSWFSYTFNGETYKMRYLTITAADAPSYAKASSKNLVQSRVWSAVYNCADTLIYAYISSLNSLLGTVASMTGFSLADIAPESRVTLDLQAGTNWTRVYTQVWSEYYQEWTYGSCVEYVTASSKVTGMVYSPSENAYVDIPGVRRQTQRYSTEYYDYDWRRQAAIIGYTNNDLWYDCVGDVEYIYDGEVVVTHRENF